MDNQLPVYVKFWLDSSHNDCYFVVGPPSGLVERIGAKKILLMGHSEPLCRMLEASDMAEKGDITLPDIEPNTFKDFLKCLYGGSSIVIKHITFVEHVKLLYVAEKYLVAHLKQELLAEMTTKPLSIDDLFVALTHPVCFHNDTLVSAMSEAISCRTDLIFSDEKFMDINSEALLLIVKQEPLNVRELEIFNAISKWAKNKENLHDGKVLRDLLTKHLQFIRFRTISCEDFSREVIPSGVLTAEEACKMCASLAKKEPHQLTMFSENDNLRFKQVFSNEKSPFVYSCVAENISSRTEMYSICFNWKDYSWRFFARKYRNGSYLSLFLDLKHNSRNSWKCNVSADLILSNQFGLPDQKRSFLNRTYNDILCDYGFRNFCEWDIVVDPKQGFIKDGRILLMAYVTLSELE